MLKKTCTTELHASSGLLFKTICQAAPKEVSQNRNLWPKKLPLSPPLVLENELLQDTGSTQKIKKLKNPTTVWETPTFRSTPGHSNFIRWSRGPGTDCAHRRTPRPAPLRPQPLDRLTHPGLSLRSSIQIQICRCRQPPGL